MEVVLCAVNFDKVTSVSKNTDVLMFKVVTAGACNYVVILIFVATLKYYLSVAYKINVCMHNCFYSNIYIGNLLQALPS